MSEYGKQKFKYITALKWGSFFTVITIFYVLITSFWVAIFPVNNFNSNFDTIFLGILFVIGIFFSIKCINEVNSKFDINLWERHQLSTKVFVVNFLFIGLFSTTTEFPIPRRKEDNFAVDELELKNEISFF